VNYGGENRWTGAELRRTKKRVLAKLLAGRGKLCLRATGGVPPIERWLGGGSKTTPPYFAFQTLMDQRKRGLIGEVSVRSMAAK